MTPDPHSRRAELLAGAQATLPLAAGATPFGIIYGALAVSSGLSPAAAQAMSALVFAGSAQFIAAGLVDQGVSAGMIVLTTLIVNLRHVLYGASLGPHLKHLSQRWLVPLGFWLTDESYAVVIARYGQPDPSPHKHWFFLGSAILMYVNWQAWTLVGVVAGQQIPNPRGWGLDYALVVTFIGIVVPLIRSRAVAVSVVASGVAAVLASGIPNRLGLMVAALTGIAAGMIAEQVWPQPAPGQEAA